MIISTLIAGGGLAFVAVDIWRRHKGRRRVPPDPEIEVSAADVPARLPAADASDTSINASNLDQKLWIACGSAAAATVGTVAFWPLRLLSVPAILFLSKDLVDHAVAEWRTRGRLSVDALALVIIAVCIKEGLLVACSLNVLLAIVSRQLIGRTRYDAEADIVRLFEQQSRYVHVMREGECVDIELAELGPDDRVRVFAGEMVPVDGRIVDGEATIDQQILTGEAQPVERGPGEQVFAMTMVASGSITVHVERSGDAVLAGQVASILRSTMAQKTPGQLRAEELGNKATLPTLAAGAVLWPMLGPSSALAVIQAHPKYKPIITSHLGLLTTLGRLADRGVLVKDVAALEGLSAIDTVVFDKTGTLTLGTFEVAAIHCEAPIEPAWLLAQVASLEAHQAHPLAEAIRAHARASGLSPSTPEDAAVVAGFGLSGVVDGQRLLVGSRRYMEREGVIITPLVAQADTRCVEAGHTLVMVGMHGETIGAIELHAAARPEAADAIRALRARTGCRVHIISGDRREPTRRLAEALDAHGYDAEVLPQDKARLIERMQAEGRRVCFVGDGINDAIALSTADASRSRWRVHRASRAMRPTSS